MNRISRADHEGASERQPPLPVELALLRRFVQVHQHDDEQEQHHDAADVEDDLDGEQEFGVQQQVQPGDAE